MERSTYCRRRFLTPPPILTLRALLPHPFVVDHVRAPRYAWPGPQPQRKCRRGCGRLSGFGPNLSFRRGPCRAGCPVLLLLYRRRGARFVRRFRHHVDDSACVSRVGMGKGVGVPSVRCHSSTVRSRSIFLGLRGSTSENSEPRNPLLHCHHTAQTDDYSRRATAGIHE